MINDTSLNQLNKHILYLKAQVFGGERLCYPHPVPNGTN
jgi:hypothetical protein